MEDDPWGYSGKDGRMPKHDLINLYKSMVDAVELDYKLTTDKRDKLVIRSLIQSLRSYIAFLSSGKLTRRGKLLSWISLMFFSKFTKKTIDPN